MGININCIHTTGFLKIHCSIKPRLWGIFLRECPLLKQPFKGCIYQEEHQRPAIKPKPQILTINYSEFENIKERLNHLEKIVYKSTSDI